MKPMCKNTQISFNKLGELLYTYSETRFFKLANTPSGRDFIAFEDKYLRKRSHYCFPVNDTISQI